MYITDIYYKKSSKLSRISIFHYPATSKICKNLLPLLFHMILLYWPKYNLHEWLDMNLWR